MRYVVTVLEMVQYRVEAGSEADARENYGMDGKEGSHLASDVVVAVEKERA